MVKGRGVANILGIGWQNILGIEWHNSGGSAQVANKFLVSGNLWELGGKNIFWGGMAKCFVRGVVTRKFWGWQGG